MSDYFQTELSESGTEGLTQAEAASLCAYEAIIERGRQTFIDVGMALCAIRDGKLYRVTHKTFESYCEERWQISRTRAYQLIVASEVAQNLSTDVDISSTSPSTILPSNEAQAREINRIPRQSQAPVWNDLVNKSGGKQPPMRDIKQAVTDFFDGEAPPEVEEYQGEKREEEGVELLPPDPPPSESHVERWARNYRPLNQDSPSGRLKRCLDTLRDIEDTARAALNTGQTWYGKALEHIMESCEGLADLQPR